jgi:hypothetical protein
MRRQHLKLDNPPVRSGQIEVESAWGHSKQSFEAVDFGVCS